MSTNTVITNVGLNFASSSFNNGTLIAIKYCVPVYDYRLDSNIHNESPTGTYSIDYSTTVSATSALSVPVGEKIWLEQSYDISNSFILSGSSTLAVSGAYTRIANCPQSVVGLGVNLLSGTPLSNSISATTFYPPSSTVYWLVDSATSARVVGVNPTAQTDRAKFWSVGDYFPSVDGNGNVVGAFKAHLNQTVGRFKFNKVAFYAVSIDAFGVEDLGVDPVFFAECFVSELAVKSNIAGDGFDDFIIDAQIDLSTLNSYGTSGYFATSGEWIKTIGGLYSPDPIGVGSFVGGVSSPQASVHVRYVESNFSKPNLFRLDASGAAGETNYVVANVSQSGDMVLSASQSGKILSTNMDFEANSVTAPVATLADVYIETITSQDGILNVYNDMEVQGSIVPSSHETYDLGTSAYYWNNAYLTNISANNLSVVNELTAGKLITNVIETAGGSIEVYGAITMENGDTINAGNVIPLDNNGENLGSPSKYWNNAYLTNISANNLSVVNELTAGKLITNVIETAGGSIEVYGAITMENGDTINAGNVIPLDNNGENLGSPSKYWSNAYIINLITSGDIDPIATNTYNLGQDDYEWAKITVRNIKALGTTDAGTVNAVMVRTSAISGTDVLAGSPIEIFNNMTAGKQNVYMGTANGPALLNAVLGNLLLSGGSSLYRVGVHTSAESVSITELTGATGTPSIMSSFYHRIGNIVNLDMVVRIEATTTSLTGFSITLPSILRCHPRYYQAGGRTFMGLNTAGSQNYGMLCTAYFNGSTTKLRVITSYSDNTTPVPFIVNGGVADFSFSLTYESY